MCSISSGGSTNSPSHQAHLHKQARNSQALYPLATRALQYVTHQLEGFTNSPSHQAHLHKQARNSQVLYPIATRAQCVPSVGGIHQLALPPGSPAQAGQEQPGTVPTIYQCVLFVGGIHAPIRFTYTSKPGTARHCTH
jgi:hypothetical protein